VAEAFGCRPCCPRSGGCRYCHDAAIPAGDDDFAAAEPAAGGDEVAGRETRESVDPRKLATTLASKKK